VRYEPFQGFKHISIVYPGLSLRSNPGLELANASGVNNTWGGISERPRRIWYKFQTDNIERLRS